MCPPQTCETRESLHKNSEPDEQCAVLYNVFLLPESPFTVLIGWERSEILLNNISVAGKIISFILLLHQKILQFDWLRAVVFQVNLKYLLMKITIFCG